MNLKTFLLITSIIYIPFGLMMLIFPLELFGFYGFELNDAGALLGRVVGAAIIGMGLINYFGRSGELSSQVLRAILIGNLVYHLIDLVTVGMATFEGLVNGWTWSFVGLHLVLSVVFGYFLMKK